jgi:hypothetical protein
MRLRPVVLLCLRLAAVAVPSIPLACWAAPAAPAPAMVGVQGVPFNPHILVDQFGYRPGDRKVAVIRDPHEGYDSGDRFAPGKTYQLRDAVTGAVVFTGALAPWRKGEVEASSGDSGWWFDFSPFTVEGTYFVYDLNRRARSATFRIDQKVYAPVLKAAVRTFFYQRSGYAKTAPWADACWIDEPAYLGPRQDLEARDIADRNNAAKSRNVFGGWFDAGDTNKYVTFASAPVHQLLSAYQDDPEVFTDDFNIPESGNGVPDLLDEVKWELDWLKRMQMRDGSVALKVGVTEYASGTKPSLDRLPRYYVGSCSSSTIAAAGMYAHAALVFGSIPALAQESAELRARAERAWRSFESSPVQTDCDKGGVKSGNADLSAQDQTAEAVVAAAYLAALTGNSGYRDYVKAHYRETRPYRDFGWSRYNPHQGEALLFYARQFADDPTAVAILADKRTDVAKGNQFYGMAPDDDLYRAYMHDSQYHWGSNQVRANYGNSNLDAARLAKTDPGPYLERAQGILNYFHGVNPFAMVYLTNMYGYGATRSVNEVFHFWFWHTSRWDNAKTSDCGPAPGFVPGGPNGSAARDGVLATLKPPVGQPAQKSYRDWNTPWPEGSWAVSEPAIYYQASYIRLLARFAR